MITRLDLQGHELVPAEEVVLLLTQLRPFDEAKVEDLICAWGLQWRCLGSERYFMLGDALEFVEVVLEVYPRRRRR